MHAYRPGLLAMLGAVILGGCRASSSPLLPDRCQAVSVESAAIEERMFALTPKPPSAQVLSCRAVPAPATGENLEACALQLEHADFPLLLGASVQEHNITGELPGIVSLLTGKWSIPIEAVFVSAGNALTPPRDIYADLQRTRVVIQTVSPRCAPTIMRS